MPSFAKIVVLAIFAAVSSASSTSGIIERWDSYKHHCPGAWLVHYELFPLGDGREVKCMKHRCKHHGHPPPPPPPPPAENVCGELCTTTCNDRAGSLPPISDDCQTIEDAIQIFQQQTTTFVVDPGHIETLTYGTCSYFFSNTGTTSLEYCWADMSNTASMAGDACFPPVQPFFSEAFCASSDQTWAVGAAHS